MYDSETIELLELPPNSTEIIIKQRAKEKLAFFEQLERVAPSPVLQKLYARNVEKIKKMLVTFGESMEEKKPSYTPSNESELTSSYTASLVLHTEGKNVQTFSLSQGVNVVGRENATILISDDRYLSRQHATLELICTPKLCLFVTDGVMGKTSKNGTYVNGSSNAIQQKTELFNGDTIQFGMTKFVIKLSSIVRNKQSLEQEVANSEYMKTVIINI